MAQSRHDKKRMPHAPDVLERQTADGGFSAGWGLHQPPSESYLVNCHTHLWALTPAKMRDALSRYFARAGAMRVRRLVAMDGKPDRIQTFARLSARDDRFLWMVWPAPEKPDLKFLKKWSKRPGFAGMKLHNHSVITQAMRPDVWLSSAWDDMLALCAEAGKPVLWHVTQRVTDAPYNGGGRDSYWKVGRPKGVTFGNRDLLDVFEQVVARHRSTQFIGAHHLHIGPEAMAKLFRRHPNLSTDLSCGNTVRMGDTLYPADQRRWRDYVIRHADRLLFGTDCCLGSTAGDWSLWEALAAHIRFLHQLHLPKDVLEKVARENFERLAHLEPVPLNPAEWLGTRP